MQSLRTWRLVFTALELTLLAQLAVCFSKLFGPKGGWDPLFADKPTLIVSLFWLVYTVADLFLLVAGPLFCKRLGVVARIAFVTALIGLLSGFLWRN